SFDSSVVLRMSDRAALAQATAYIGSPAVALQARPEPEYYADLSQKTGEIVALTTILITIMAIGAAFAVANTMYAAVDGRRREIAMLRTLGFPKRAILISIMLESVMICLLACACGLAGAALLHGRRQDYMSDTTFTVLAYELRVTPK